MEKSRTVGWNFDNSYLRLPRSFYKVTSPTIVKEPKLVIVNDSLATSLGLDSQMLHKEEAASIFAGNKLPEGASPLAQAYAGHQFGHFTMLGDGRAILLGEQITPTQKRFDIQLKGPGRTPYSRGGDGRAAIGPMLREYIISEAMHGLGIPTTRSLAVVTTGETIIRDSLLPGAILTRVASSHIRVGTFQYVATWGTEEELKILADYTINRHFPALAEEKNPYLAFLQEVMKRQASLIAKWQLAGFVHGVMNTDNMLISGETVDYGPCAFMDTYDPATVFSSIDVQGRYAYGNQPYIAGWNLARLAETLLPLLHHKQEEAIEIAQGALSPYSECYRDNWLNGMRRKLGISNEEKADETLIEELLALMKQNKADYTNTFKALTFGTLDNLELCKTPQFTTWHEGWQQRMSRQAVSKEAVHELMKQSNPAVIPRNHRVEEALEAATTGDYSVLEKLLQVLKNPYAHREEQGEYCVPSNSSDGPYQTFCGT